MLQESQPSQLCTTWKDPSILIELLGNAAKILQSFHCVHPKRRFCVLNQEIQTAIFPQPFPLLLFQTLQVGRKKNHHIRKLLVLQTWLCNCLQAQRIRVEQLASHSWSASHSFELQATKQSLGSNCHCFPKEARRCRDSEKTGREPKGKRKHSGWI